MRLACPYQLSPTQNLLGNGMQASARNAAGGVDPYWANVVLLAINDNAADGTTTFIDQSASAHTMTAVGNAQYDTAQAPTGMTSSMLLDKTGDGLSTLTNANFGFGTGDFAMEGFCRATSTTGNQVLLDLRAANSGPLLYSSSSNLIFFGAAANRITATGALVINTWFHWAAARTSGVTQMWVDGTQVGTDYTDANNYGATNRCFVGLGNDGANGWGGWQGCVRVTKGSNRGYVGASITVPTLPMPTS